MHKHAGKIQLSEAGLVAMLGYSGGKLHFCGRSEDYACLSVMIEHPAMPEVPVGRLVPIVDSPTHYTYEGEFRILPNLTRLEALREAWNILTIVYRYSRWHVSLRRPGWLRRMAAWIGKTAKKGGGS